MTEIHTLDDGTEYVIHSRSCTLEFDQPPAHHTVDPFAKYSPDQPRDDHGRFAPIAGTIAARTLIEDGDTATYHGKQVTSGKSVSPYPERSRVIRERATDRPARRALLTREIGRFRKDNADLLSQPGHALGTWYDTDDGALWLDVVVVVDSAAEAATLARAHNQKAYYDLDEGREVRTGGTGLVKRFVDFLGLGRSRPSEGHDHLERGRDGRGDRGRDHRVLDPLTLAKEVGAGPSGHVASGVTSGPGLPPLSSRERQILSIVAKFDPSQPRDDRGRWTAADDGDGDEWKSIDGLTFTAGVTPSGIIHEVVAIGRVGGDWGNANDPIAIGRLTWKINPGALNDGEIQYVMVEEKYRRMGLATELLRQARDLQPNVHHSKNLSVDGKAWAEVVKFDPSQRRAPKGTPLGGQWIDDDTGQGSDLLSPGAEHGPVFTPTGKPAAPNNPDATRVSSMPPEFLKKQCAKLAAVGLSSADLERNIEAIYLRARDEFPEVCEMGREWYVEANERIGEHAQENGFDKDVAIGMTAAMSPSSEWGQNIAMVGELMRQHNANDRIRLSPDEASELLGRDNKHASALVAAVGKDGVGPRFNNLPPEQAAWAFMVTGQRRGLLSEVPTLNGVYSKVQFATGARNITKAIRMARGENISVAIGGQHKIRSFFNNLKDPRNSQGRGDVTIDTHAASVAQAFRMPMVSNRADDTFWNGSSRASNQNGLYPIYADAYRAVAAKHGLEPNQLQAIAWVTWQHVRHEYPGIVARKGQDLDSAPSTVTDDYTEARATTRARYGVQVGKRDGVGPRYSSQVSDWEQYQDGAIDYQTYLQRIGSDHAY